MESDWFFAADVQFNQGSLQFLVVLVQDTVLVGLVLMQARDHVRQNTSEEVYRKKHAVEYKEVHKITLVGVTKGNQKKLLSVDQLEQCE